MRTGLLVGAMGAVTLTTTLGLVVVLVTQPFVPEQLQDVAAATTALVTSEEFVDERSVSLDLVVGDSPAIVLPVGGAVTAVACTAGATIESGSSPVSVDGVPVLALSTTTPPWRDLVAGDRGSDVAALQAELTRLGHDVSSDGQRVGRATTAAVRALADAHGLTLPSSGGLPMASVIWLRAPSLPIASCEVRLGDAVLPGAVLARTPAPLEGARVAVLPPRLVPGERVVTLDGVDLPVDEKGAVTDPAALGAIAATSSYAAATATGDGTQSEGGPGGQSIAGSLRLAEAVTVTVVPPGAIATDDGATGCLTSADGVDLPVSIVGSQLGQTFVVFPAGLTPVAVALDAPGRAACP